MVDGFTMTPMYIWNACDLTDKEKIIYSLLTSLTASKGFSWASNKYMAEELNSSERTISRTLSRLKEIGYIDIEMEKKMVDGKLKTLRKVYILGEDKVKEVFKNQSRQNGLGGVDTDGEQIDKYNRDINKLISLCEREDFQIKEKDKNKLIKSINSLLLLLDGDDTDNLTALQLIDVWNSLDDKHKFKKVNTSNLSSAIIKDIKTQWRTKRKEVTKEEFYTSIENYIKDIESRPYDPNPKSYSNHRFDLPTFLRQKNGMLKFL